MTAKGPSPSVQVSIHYTMPDIEMESVGSCEYDQDDLEFEEPPVRMANATLGQGTQCGSTHQAFSNLRSQGVS